MCFKTRDDRALAEQDYQEFEAEYERELAEFVQQMIDDGVYEEMKHQPQTYDELALAVEAEQDLSSCEPNDEIPF